MWISHFAPALVISRFSPSTPIWALALAGSLPDFLFFVFALVGIESIKYDGKSEDPTYKSMTGGSGSSCFPYDCDYPYTHSLPGIAVIGLVWAGLITAYKKLPSLSFLALFAATLTHFPLDLAVHRHDVAITPSEPTQKRHGIPLFDYPWAVFGSDLGLFVLALMFHARTANPAGPGGATQPRRNATKAYLVALLVATVVQADFSFFGAPGTNARFLHGPIFMGEVLALSWALGKLEGFTDTGGKMQVKTGDMKKRT